MKAHPPKSMLSPREQVTPSSSSQASLSTSLGRKTKNNGSLKGVQASPIFPPGASSSRRGANKRKGSGNGSPEPSSPKVTCIGQVRVKGKNRSKIAGGNETLGEFGSRSVKCVHFPFKDFTCLIPCRSGFYTSKEEIGGSDEEGRRSGCCGPVVARWVFDHGAVKGRKIELVVEGEEIEKEEEELEARRTYRRNLFHEIEFTDSPPLSSDSARVSICIPPKNALLLMRCRSDPVKAAALASKFLEAPTIVEEDNDEETMEKIGGDMEDEDKGGTDEELKSCLILDLRRDDTLTESSRKSLAAALIETKEAETEDYENPAPEQTLEDGSAEETPVSQVNEEPELPNCLLLMMCEPKLSMEVSKETWVCSTDFIRWVPGSRPRHSSKKTDAGEIPEKRKRVNPVQSPSETTLLNEQESKPKQQVHSQSHVINKGGHVAQWKLQPPRSSCHFPSQQREEMASPVERQLTGFDPFVLTRCKSEPMRTALVG